MIELLLDNGADINEQDGHFNTALVLASDWDDEAVVELLLNKDADVNA